MTEPKTTEAPDDAARHAQKMARKKAARDKIMAGKEGEKGLIIIHTGAGKGKSSSAFGMILRNSEHRGSATAHMVRQLGAPGNNSKYRAEFLELVESAARLTAQAVTPP